MGQSRNEDILENMLGAENELPAPQSRIEELLQQILEQGSGGGKLYLHQVRINKNDSSEKCDGWITIINRSNTALTFTPLWEYLKSLNDSYPVVGSLYDKTGAKLYNLYRVYATKSGEQQANTFSLNYMKDDGSYGDKTVYYLSVSDLVIEI